jgi:hypothetical protein
MKATLPSPLRLLLLLLLLAPQAQAGLGPQNVMVVVNSASPASLAVANEYVAARHIPPANVVYIDLPKDLVEFIRDDDFRKLILKPVLEQIRIRNLAAQIDCVTYSADFPHAVNVQYDINDRPVPKVLTPRASINGLTYLYRQALQNDINYLSLASNHYAPPLPQNATPQPIKMIPPRGFHRTTGWAPDGAPLPNHPEQGYLLSTVLGVTAGRGNTIDEIKQMIHRSVAADGTAPKGTIYYMLNQDVRSKTRKWGFNPAIAELKKYGVKGEILDGVLPRNKKDVAGVMVGVSDFDWPRYGSTILPGAICEHLTSAGGVMFTNGGQTCISEFIRAGASGTSGAVLEPFAIQEKFPTPFIHAYYAAGCSLAEAFYQSVSGPYQLLIIGDPLCCPWRKPCEITLNIKPNATLKGPLALEPVCKSPDFHVAHFELFIDGFLRSTIQPGKEWGLNTTQLADGYHELRAVAISSDAVESQGQLILPVTVDNHSQHVTVTPPKTTDGASPIDASMKGAKRLILLQNGREIAATGGDSASFHITPDKVGPGPVTLYVVAIIDATDGEQRIASDPIQLNLPAPR